MRLLIQLCITTGPLSTAIWSASTRAEAVGETVKNLDVDRFNVYTDEALVKVTKGDGRK